MQSLAFSPLGPRGLCPPLAGPVTVLGVSLQPITSARPVLSLSFWKASERPWEPHMALAFPWDPLPQPFLVFKKFLGRARTMDPH